MELKRDKNHNSPKKPEGDRPKGGYITPLMIALVLVLVFSWVSNAVEKSQYTETRWDEFVAENHIDLTATDKRTGEKVLTLWCWDMCGD